MGVEAVTNQEASTPSRLSGTPWRSLGRFEEGVQAASTVNLV